MFHAILRHDAFDPANVGAYEDDRSTVMRFTVPGVGGRVVLCLRCEGQVYAAKRGGGRWGTQSSWE